MSRLRILNVVERVAASNEAKVSRTLSLSGEQPLDLESLMDHAGDCLNLRFCIHTGRDQYKLFDPPVLI